MPTSSCGFPLHGRFETLRKSESIPDIRAHGLDHSIMLTPRICHDLQARSVPHEAVVSDRNGDWPVQDSTQRSANTLPPSNLHLLAPSSHYLWKAPRYIIPQKVNRFVDFLRRSNDGKERKKRIQNLRIQKGVILDLFTPNLRAGQVKLARSFLHSAAADTMSMIA